MDHAKYWRRLVRDLDGWSSASEAAPGRIRVLVPKDGGGRRAVYVVMTPEQWVDMFSVAHGSVDLAFDRVKQTLLALPPCDPAPMERGVDTWWDHLVDVLATVGEVTERDPRGLTIVLARGDGSTQVVEVDMSPDEWDDMCCIGGWQMERGAQHVRQLVLDQPPALRYLTYAHYMLTPASTDWERG